MSEADKAYEAAKRLIAKAIKNGTIDPEAGADLRLVSGIEERYARTLKALNIQETQHNSSGVLADESRFAFNAMSFPARHL